MLLHLVLLMLVLGCLGYVEVLRVDEILALGGGWLLPRVKASLRQRMSHYTFLNSFNLALFLPVLFYDSLAQAYERGFFRDEARLAESSRIHYRVVFVLFTRLEVV